MLFSPSSPFLLRSYTLEPLQIPLLGCALDPVRFRPPDHLGHPTALPMAVCEVRRNESLISPSEVVHRPRLECKLTLLSEHEDTPLSPHLLLGSPWGKEFRIESMGDPHRRQTIFCFDEIIIREVGRYRLKFTLSDSSAPGDELDPLQNIQKITEPFEVVTYDEFFPDVTLINTDLNKHLKRQNLPLNFPVTADEVVELENGESQHHANKSRRIINNYSPKKMSV
ncbi:hypothetical protein O181_027977 [Austropuccinia psidii MF-1]|uniref:Velvet domain-containing protein n=1 Tax=Austropuccinia psidii MF-1 TaxID=1389203 RepID=A0A9Q3H264_9BASI|nr:hypothetical protein [Austropuccinia psidii MF-1]